MPRNAEVAALAAALAEPFEPGVIRWKPQQVKGNRCLAVCYLDARIVEDRLDTVLGPENWTDAYEVLNDGSVICRLAVRFGEEWLTKSDVGSPSEQPDLGDRLKAAFSDALKRAAVKYGIGRFLYALPMNWVDYDPVKKQIVTPPQLPAWALPKKGKPTGNVATPAKAPEPAKKAEAPKQEQPKPAPEANLVNLWEKKIDQIGDVESLNAAFKAFPKEIKDKAARQYIWEYMFAFAQERGWEFDETEKAFWEPVDNHQSGDPIAF